MILHIPLTLSEIIAQRMCVLSLYIVLYDGVWRTFADQAAAQLSKVICSLYSFAWCDLRFLDLLHLSSFNAGFLHDSFN